MAFQQPQRPRPSRPLSFSQPAQQQPVQRVAVSPHRKHSVVESEEWVLFSPSVDGRTHTTSTERTPRTVGISQLSDFGSLDTAARSENYEERDDEDNLTCQGTNPEDEADTEELDSLDDGLHAFHEPSLSAPQVGESSQTVFPTHDGLGTFPSSSAAVQEQLWQFERYNASPRKTKAARRRSSVQRRLDVLEERETLEHDERRERIERWRLEQSRALLDEIERETRRRRRMSRVTIAKSTAGSTIAESSRPAAEAEPSAADASPLGTSPADSSDGESFWQRFTRRVIRDLMGIDENLLSVILGQSLPADASSTTSGPDPKDVLAAAATESADNMSTHDSWEQRLLERISRELGVLVNQLSEHPGAFSTYLRTQEAPAYAGLATSADSTTPRRLSLHASSSATPDVTQSQSISNINFAPTVPPQPSYSEASLWGIEEEPEPEPAASEASAQAQHEREYWERDLDVKMVFNFLKERFSSRPTSPVNGSPPNRRDSANPFQPKGADSTAGSQERAALIRQHHPLVSRNLPTSSAQAHSEQLASSSSRPAPNATATTTTITVPVPVPVSRANLQRSRLSNRNAGSSCASQSTRRSKRSGSSKNYWDLGGSVGSGPAGAPSAATWGEV
ncbi:uncharacterized protein BKCO1_3700074 [Diplodia corticola]|uniref:Uncharacterized protein n=1 Tax=Diplodia corticola TaxID=236234 RepID=A0A1J9QUJ0_9PEZI|nr:uncharacterized protein BKCO1_3700074 [Diplodia corticola]OJD32638.1 hypothetical protein BKCO1_3700074 [Diplodia corticola]